MGELRIETYIDARREICFDLLRHPRVLVDAEVSGPFSLGQSITFQSRWFGIEQKLRVRVVEFDPPHGFVDEMTEGKLRSFVHIHKLEDVDAATRLIDIVHWASPFGPIGKMFDELVLKRRIRELVTDRNTRLKNLASIARNGS